MFFKCSYCGTIFNNFHHDIECQEVLQEAIFNAMKHTDRTTLRVILNYINNLSK
jgi:hypothetical protein